MNPDKFSNTKDSGNTDNPLETNLESDFDSDLDAEDFWQELNAESTPGDTGDNETGAIDVAAASPGASSDGVPNSVDAAESSDLSDLFDVELSGSIDAESVQAETVDQSNHGNDSDRDAETSGSDSMMGDLYALLDPVVDVNMAIANSDQESSASSSDPLLDNSDSLDNSSSSDRADNSAYNADHAFADVDAAIETEDQSKPDSEGDRESQFAPELQADRDMSEFKNSGSMSSPDANTDVSDLKVEFKSESQAQSDFAVSSQTEGSDLFAADDLADADLEPQAQAVDNADNLIGSDRSDDAMSGEADIVAQDDTDGTSSDRRSELNQTLQAQQQEIAAATAELEQLKHEESGLRLEIERLKSQKQKILQAQLDELQTSIDRLTTEQILELEQKRNELQASVSVLQRKQERLQKEMRTTYAGISQDIAVRVQGFKDYLVGSLQDLVASAEQLDLVPPTPEPTIAAKEPTPIEPPQPPELATQSFGEFRTNVEKILEQYRTLPDYYGPPWKLRRTFEQAHAERVSNWLFEQAGRGAVRTMGTRLQNILVAAAAVSVMRAIYGDRVRVLVLATAPERLGEWRRGFQDCLGISRDSFGPDRGVVLFEDPDPLAFKGDRLVQEGLKPMVIVDEAEEFLFIDMLRFPLLLAFGRDPEARTSSASRNYYRDFMDF
jgi:hypothetical protein